MRVPPRVVTGAIALAALGVGLPAAAHAAPGESAAAAPAGASLDARTSPGASLDARTSAGATTSRTLKGRGGFRARVPRGYRLRTRKGVYTISNGKVRLVYMRARTKTTPASAGTEIARVLRARTVRRSATARRFRATIEVGGRKRVLDIRRRGRYLVLATLADAGARRSSVATPQATTSITAADIVALRRILASARGGRVVVPSGRFPMRPFTAADGSATAFVPNIGNWTFNGRQGVIEGGNANQGGFAFGVTFFVQDPGSPFANPGQPIFPYTDAAGALVNVIPQWFRICCNTTLTNVRAIGTLVGQERFSLGPGYLSGMFSAAFNLNGRPWQGIFHVGTNANTGIFGAWYVYYSYAAVRVGEDPRIGAALLESWATWNPSADQNRRLNEALFNVLTTNVGGGPIDPAVFDAAAAKWSEYIRQ